MLSPIKLDTFILKDKFSLKPEQLSEEAEASASKRAEVMDWQVSHVRLSDQEPIRDGDFICYTFEIWGMDAGGATKAKSDRQESNPSDGEKQAAREANL